MKIEYFEPDVEEQSTVLIYGNEPDRVSVLVEAVRSLVNKERQRFAVHELPGFDSVNECQLFFSAESSDRGAQLVGQPRVFECNIRPLWWENVEGLLELFCSLQSSASFQFLDTGFDSEVQLIISTDRGW